MKGRRGPQKLEEEHGVGDALGRLLAGNLENLRDLNRKGTKDNCVS